MKALIIIIAIFFSANTGFAHSEGIFNKGKKKTEKREQLKHSVDKQINRHLYYPGENIEGKADVMLEVMPKGDMRVVLIQTANPLMKKFIERQVKKMKVNQNEVVAGELFKYRIVFRAKE